MSTNNPAPPSPNTTVSKILSTWSTTTLLPPTIPIPPSLPASLISALHTLSLLTPSQPDRAWNLLNTYFRARIREASYTGSHNAIYAALDVSDVHKAICSVRRMSVGFELECGSGRKYSIRDEIEGGGKRRRVEEEEDEDDGLPPLPEILDMGSTRRASETPERRVQLPSIQELVDGPLVRAPVELVEAARAATHETNLRRRELEAAEEKVRVARRRYDEAKGLAEGLRLEVKRAEKAHFAIE